MEEKNVKSFSNGPEGPCALSPRTEEKHRKKRKRICNPRKEVYINDPSEASWRQEPLPPINQLRETVRKIKQQRCLAELETVKKSSCQSIGKKKGGRIMALTVQDLLEAGCHFGHQTKRWNPKMKDFVYGAKNGISIIDITKTIHQVADACNFLQDAVAKGANVLFVGTKRQAQQIVKEASEATNMNFVTERWMGGLLTNNATIRKSVKKMQDIDAIVADENTTLKKKEVSLLSRQSEKLHKDLDGIASMKKLPDILVVVDVCHDDIAVKEARKLSIPIVAIVDTNGNPDLIDYPVAANDDAVKSIKVIMDTFVEAIKDAAEIWGKKAAEEKLKAETAAAEKVKEAGLRRRTAPGAKRPLSRRPARKTAAKPAEGEAAPAAAEGASEAPAAAAPAAEGEVKKAPRKAPVKKAAAPKTEKAEKAPKAEKAEKAEKAPKAE